MPPIPPSAPAERLTGIIDLLCRATAARIAGGFLAGPVILLIWSYLRRLGARFVRLAGCIAAGRAAVRRRAAPRQPASRPPPPPRLLPHGFAWLVRLVPAAATGAAQLQALLAEPEMAALIAAAPQMRRVLRPLCRMLGVTPPPARALPADSPAATAPSRPAAAVLRPSGAAPPAPAPGRRWRRSAPRPHPPACGPPPIPA